MGGSITGGVVVAGGVVVTAAGIVSFLIQQVPHRVTLVLLLLGAGLCVKGTWFSSQSHNH